VGDKTLRKTGMRDKGRRTLPGEGSLKRKIGSHKEQEPEENAADGGLLIYWEKFCPSTNQANNEETSSRLRRAEGGSLHEEE